VTVIRSILVLCVACGERASWSSEWDVADRSCLVIDAEHCRNRLRQRISSVVLRQMPRRLVYTLGGFQLVFDALDSSWLELPPRQQGRTFSARIDVPPDDSLAVDRLFERCRTTPPPRFTITGIDLAVPEVSCGIDARIQWAFRADELMEDAPSPAEERVMRARDRAFGYYDQTDDELVELGRRNRARAHELGVDAAEHQEAERKMLTSGRLQRAPAFARKTALAPPSDDVPTMREKR
jgi:hypothetical protein